MTRDRTTERRISDWLVGEGEYELPDRVLAETFHQAAVTRQVRALPGWRIFQMDRKFISFAAGAAAIAVLVIAGAAYFGQPDASGVGGAPTPSPTPTPVASAAPSAPPSLVAPGISGWTPYTSAAYGFTMSYPSDWSVADPASHKWQPGQPANVEFGVVGHLRERRGHRWRFDRHACVPGACPNRGRPGVLGRPARRAPGAVRRTHHPSVSSGLHADADVRRGGLRAGHHRAQR